jgi:hypothetical protein
MSLSHSGPLARDVTTCRKCGASIVFLQSMNQRTRKRGRMPVNILPTKSDYRGPNAGEIDYVAGEHQSHFATCPDAEYFKGGR